MTTALEPATVADLWAQARELARRASVEADHAALRRALVICAVAGSGADPDEFRRLLAEVHTAALKLVFADPQPLFDAAAALVAEEDLTAREIIVLAPSVEHATRDPGDQTMYGMLRSRTLDDPT